MNLLKIEKFQKEEKGQKAMQANFRPFPTLPIPILANTQLSPKSLRLDATKVESVEITPGINLSDEFARGAKDTTIVVSITLGDYERVRMLIHRDENKERRPKLKREVLGIHEYTILNWKLLDLSWPPALRVS